LTPAVAVEADVQRLDPGAQPLADRVFDTAAGGPAGAEGDAATTAYYGLGRPKTEFGVVRAGLNYRFSTD
jgi:hypothetical protein